MAKVGLAGADMGVLTYCRNRCLSSRCFYYIAGHARKSIKLGAFHLQQWPDDLIDAAAGTKSFASPVKTHPARLVMNHFGEIFLISVGPGSQRIEPFRIVRQIVAIPSCVSKTKLK